MGFPRQEYLSGLLFPSRGDLPGPVIKAVSPALAGGFLTTESPGKPIIREMEIKTIRGYHFTPTRMTVMKMNSNVVASLWTNQNLHMLLVEMQNGVASLKNCLVIPPSVVTMRHINSYFITQQFHS